MEIVSYNVNGIRSAIDKGLLDWLKQNNFDVVCLQETKAQPEQLDLTVFTQLGYHAYWHSAEKKGYSGVATLSKTEPAKVTYGCGIADYDREGRVLRLDFENDLSVMNVYLPSGSSGEERQAFKMQCLADFLPYCLQIKAQHPKLLIGGDFNICHRPIDIHDPVGNKKSSGFLPEERAWMDTFFNNGFVDTFRIFNPDMPDRYSWWSFRANARNKNKGWRIDYWAASAELQAHLKNADIFDQIKHADHCPVFVSLDL